MFINRINISSVNFGIFVMEPKDDRKGAKPQTKGDEFVKSSVIIEMKTLPNFEEESYESIEGKNLWIDDTKRFLKSHPSQAGNVADNFVHMIYSNSFLKDLQNAKKSGDDVDVDSFFAKASLLVDALYRRKLSAEDMADIEDGLDLLEYSYENDSLIELANKKDHSVWLDDFVSLGKDDLPEEKRSKIEEDLQEYFDESFLVAPKPVLKLEMQIDEETADGTYIEAFRKFLTMSRNAAKKYKNEDN